jgi:(1->4)-alpha-D-glucan 1-alpha-D-glucosylmutase
MLKAVREAKEKSSWANPNASYESAMIAFVDEVLAVNPDNAFLTSLVAFNQDVARVGMLNGLSQTLLKLTCPGVPDLYQGTELWDLSLVDPDNRRPVDYPRRVQILQEMKNWPKSGEALKACMRELIKHMSDGRIKMFLTWKALNLRKQRPKLFQEGNYLPLNIQGPKAKHLLSFVRRHGGDELIVVVPRLCARLFDGQGMFSTEPDLWKDTGVELGNGSDNRVYRNIFTGDSFELNGSERNGFLEAVGLFGDFPVTVLVSESGGEPERQKA